MTDLTQWRNSNGVVVASLDSLGQLEIAVEAGQTWRYQVGDSWTDWEITNVPETYTGIGVRAFSVGSSDGIRSFGVQPIGHPLDSKNWRRIEDPTPPVYLECAECGGEIFGKDYLCQGCRER